jgi:hypothetical protein
MFSNAHAAIAAPLAVAALAVATPGPAAASSSVTTDRSCYAPGEGVIEKGTGFTPNAQVLETLSLFASGSQMPLDTLIAPILTADAQGNFTRALRAPNLANQQDRTEMAVGAFTDQVAPPQTGPVLAPAWTLSAWDMRISAWANGRGDPRRSMVVDTIGWTVDAKTLYAHYYRGSKLIKDARIGALTGACGDLRKRVRQFPFHPVRPGMWTVYFSGTAHFDKTHDLWMRGRVRVGA